MRAAGEDVGGQGCGALDGHGLLTAEFKQSHLSCQRTRKGLGVANQTCRGQGEVVPDLEEFLNTLVCNEMTHGRTVVRADDDASLERDTDGAGSGLHDGLVF